MNDCVWPSMFQPSGLVLASPAVVRASVHQAGVPLGFAAVGFQPAKVTVICAGTEQVDRCWS